MCNEKDVAKDLAAGMPLADILDKNVDCGMPLADVICGTLNSGVNQRSFSVSSTGAMPFARIAATTPRTFALSSAVRNAAVL